jgi:hypothetical protein
MPDEAPPTIEPTREPICEKCSGALEQLTHLSEFDHPGFDIFCCIACGVVSWIAQEAEEAASVADTPKQTQSQITVGRGLIQRNSSGLLKPLEGVALMKALRILRRSFARSCRQSRRSGDPIEPDRQPLS